MLDRNYLVEERESSKTGLNKVNEQNLRYIVVLHLEEDHLDDLAQIIYRRFPLI